MTVPILRLTGRAFKGGGIVWLAVAALLLVLAAREAGAKA